MAHLGVACPWPLHSTSSISLIIITIIIIIIHPIDVIWGLCLIQYFMKNVSYLAPKILFHLNICKLKTEKVKIFQICLLPLPIGKCGTVFFLKKIFKKYLFFEIHFCITYYVYALYTWYIKIRVYFTYIYFWESARAKAGGAEREEDGESQAAACGQQRGARTLKFPDHDLSGSRRPGGLSHPGAPSVLVSKLKTADHHT